MKLQSLPFVLIPAIICLEARSVFAFAPSSSICTSLSSKWTRRCNDFASTHVLYSIQSDVRHSPETTVNIGLQEEGSTTLLDAQAPPSITSLSTRQSAQTIGYRVSLLATSAAYGLQIVLPVLQEAGLSISVASNVNDATSIAMTACTVAACALAPKRTGTSTGSTNNGVMVVDGKVLAASVATAIASQPLVGLAALFVREIYYFGLAYKVEAALGLMACLAVLLVPDSVLPLPVSNAAACLALAVMVFGKFLEPLQEDWQPNQSEFLARDEMK